MGPWDFLHCPPGTAHILIGTGHGPCAIVMVGTRAPDRTIGYVPDPAAARYGAAVAEATDSPREAYADRPPSVRCARPGRCDPRARAGAALPSRAWPTTTAR